MKATFAEVFCGHYRVPAARYAEAMLWRCLYPWARPVKPLLRWLDRAYFSADYSLIEGVGRLRGPEGLAEEINDFQHALGHRRFLRRTLRLRVSARRVTRVFLRLMVV